MKEQVFIYSDPSYGNSYNRKEFEDYIRNDFFNPESATGKYYISLTIKSIQDNNLIDKYVPIQTENENLSCIIKQNDEDYFVSKETMINFLINKLPDEDGTYIFNLNWASSSGGFKY